MSCIARQQALPLERTVFITQPNVSVKDPISMGTLLLMKGLEYIPISKKSAAGASPLKSAKLDQKGAAARSDGWSVMQAAVQRQSWT